MKAIAGSLVLAAVLALSAASQAADSCTKECQEFLKACQQAHSKGACQNDYNICMKHCREK